MTRAVRPRVRGAWVAAVTACVVALVTVGSVAADAAPLVAPAATVGPSLPSTFVDAPVGTPFFEHIEWLARHGISRGSVQPDGSVLFQPSAPVRREAMAAFLYRFAGEPVFTAPAVSPFVDLTPTSPFYPEICWLSAQGISTGTDMGDGTFQFRPAESVSREAMAAFLYRLMGEPVFAAPGTSPFVDLDLQSPFYAEISWLAASGISTGTRLGDGTSEFRPSESVRREAMAAFLRRSDAFISPGWDARTVAAGYEHTVAVAADGTVLAWGGNGYGQLGDGPPTGRLAPAAVPGLSGVVEVAAGAFHSLALTSDGAVFAWGRNSSGELGDGSAADRSSPVPIPGLSGIVAVDSKDAHSLALAADGTVYAWGYNGTGQIGDGTTADRWSPVQVPGVSGIVAVSAGASHSLALASDGTVYAWGSNWDGELGDGSTVDRPSPIQVPGLSGIVSISAGSGFSLALAGNGTLYAWGDDSYRQLGVDYAARGLSPVKVPDLEGVVAIDAGWAYALALAADGTALGWGYDLDGQLGDGTTVWFTAPVQVSGLSGLLSVVAGYAHSLAVGADGSVYSWGYNYRGQLGDSTGISRLTPVRVMGPG